MCFAPAPSKRSWHSGKNYTPALLQSMFPAFHAGQGRTQLLTHGAAQAARDLRADRQTPLPLVARVQRPAQHDAAPAERVELARAAAPALVRLGALLRSGRGCVVSTPASVLNCL